jgi:hypothetical protein
LDAFSFWQAHPPPQKALDNFNFLMTCVRGEEPRWLSWFPFRERILEGARPGEVLLVDVGGGRGHDAVAFKKRIDKESPGARVVLQDLPAVLSDVSNLDGIEKVSHDFFTPQVIKGWFSLPSLFIPWMINSTFRRACLLLRPYSSRLV